MNRDLKDMRENYTKGSLSIEDMDENPMVQFKKWFAAAQDASMSEPNAMILSTVSAEGMPSSRTVLLKEVDDDGFVFYTNYLSQKAIEIEATKMVSIVFLWKEMERQVRIVGSVDKTSRERSKTYFQSRPKNSQLGAWASQQSAVISDREMLEQRLADLQKKHEHDEVLPVPDFWGGYKITPLEIEFWQGRRSRLHDRLRYTSQNDAWKIDRLSP